MKTSLHPFIRRGIAATAALVIASSFGGCGSSALTLTQANLDKIQPNMTSADVKAILGEPGESKSEPIPIVGGTKTTYIYSDSQHDSIIVILKNDSVQTKEGHFGSSN